MQILWYCWHSLCIQSHQDPNQIVSSFRVFWGTHCISSHFPWELVRSLIYACWTSSGVSQISSSSQRHRPHRSHSHLCHHLPTHLELKRPRLHLRPYFQELRPTDGASSQQCSSTLVAVTCRRMRYGLHASVSCQNLRNGWYRMSSRAFRRHGQIPRHGAVSGQVQICSWYGAPDWCLSPPRTANTLFCGDWASTSEALSFSSTEPKCQVFRLFCLWDFSWRAEPRPTSIYACAGHDFVV